MFVLPPLENFHREPIYILYFLFPPYHPSPPMGETLMRVKSTCTYIYTSEAVFPGWQKLSKSFAKLLEECFYFFSNNHRCQPDLANYWRYSQRNLHF
jgi:hypothetical protein